MITPTDGKNIRALLEYLKESQGVTLELAQLALKLGQVYSDFRVQSVANSYDIKGFIDEATRDGALIVDTQAVSS